jgi:hypothetical protein
MTVKKLKEYLEKNEVPDSAEIFIYADYGNYGKVSGEFVIFKNGSTNDCNEIIFEFNDK